MVTMIMSIRAEWVRKILSGEKTVELRKVLPDAGSINHKYPFKVLIYCTQRRKLLTAEDIPLNGKIVGEFQCDKIVRVMDYGARKVDRKALAASCVSELALMEYSQGKDVYGLHISEMVAYQRPRELAEYGIRRAPQSFCYVEDY